MNEAIYIHPSHSPSALLVNPNTSLSHNTSLTQSLHQLSFTELFHCPHSRISALHVYHFSLIYLHQMRRNNTISLVYKTPNWFSSKEISVKIRVKSTSFSANGEHRSISFTSVLSPRNPLQPIAALLISLSW